MGHPGGGRIVCTSRSACWTHSQSYQCSCAIAALHVNTYTVFRKKCCFLLARKAYHTSKEARPKLMISLCCWWLTHFQHHPPIQAIAANLGHLLKWEVTSLREKRELGRGKAQACPLEGEQEGLYLLEHGWREVLKWVLL